jgi:aminoglycoside phosphotransferase (APT) family kinase protein
MKDGELLGSGRSADVYALDGDRVLRRYRSEMDASREAPVMAHLAAHGYPVPEVFPGDHPRTDLVMRRLSGPTMLHALLAGEMAVEEAGAVLARLLLRLHEVPARLAADPGDRVLHLDLHPDNVMLTPDGPVVIDWSNTEEGPPELDCAMSALILAEAGTDTESEVAGPARAVLSALLAGLGDAMRLGEPLTRVKARRAANPTLSTQEIGRLDAAVELIRTLHDATRRPADGDARGGSA